MKKIKFSHLCKVVTTIVCYNKNLKKNCYVFDNLSKIKDNLSTKDLKNVKAFCAFLKTKAHQALILLYSSKITIRSSSNVLSQTHALISCDLIRHKKKRRHIKWCDNRDHSPDNSNPPLTCNTSRCIVQLTRENSYIITSVLFRETIII